MAPAGCSPDAASSSLDSCCVSGASESSGSCSSSRARLVFIGFNSKACVEGEVRSRASCSRLAFTGPRSADAAKPRRSLLSDALVLLGRPSTPGCCDTSCVTTEDEEDDGVAQVQAQDDSPTRSSPIRIPCSEHVSLRAQRGAMERAWRQQQLEEWLWQRARQAQEKAQAQQAVPCGRAVRP